MCFGPVGGTIRYYTYSKAAQIDDVCDENFFTEKYKFFTSRKWKIINFCSLVAPINLEHARLVGASKCEAVSTCVILP